MGVTQSLKVLTYAVWHWMKEMAKAAYPWVKKNAIEIYRVVAVPVWIGGAAVLGFSSIVIIFFNISIDVSNSLLARNMFLGVSVFGGGVVLAVVKEMTNIVPPIWEFLTNNKVDHVHLAKASATVFAASFGLFLSVFAAGKGLDVEKLNFSIPNAVVINKEVRFAFQSVMPFTFADPEKTIATFHVLFEKDGGLNSLEVAGDESVNPDAFFIPFLASLLYGLSECRASDGERVTIEIRGYASSSKWDDASGDCISSELSSRKRVNNRDEAFNLCIAEKRAFNVHKKLMEIMSRKKLRDHFDIRMPSWNSYQEMLQNIGFKDVDGGGVYGGGRGFLTRRADIRILRAPGCEVNV